MNEAGVGFLAIGWALFAIVNAGLWLDGAGALQGVAAIGCALVAASYALEVKRGMQSIAQNREQREAADRPETSEHAMNTGKPRAI